MSTKYESFYYFHKTIYRIQSCFLFRVFYCNIYTCAWLADESAQIICHTFGGKMYQSPNYLVLVVNSVHRIILKKTSFLLLVLNFVSFKPFTIKCLLF